MKIIPAFALGAVVLHGCSGLQPAAPPTHTIFVLDSTASIVPGSFAQAVKAIESYVGQMRRGDCMTVLPILSDSDALPSEDIVRGCAPTHREPYDQDLKAFRQTLRSHLEDQAKRLSTRRAVETDMLGTMNFVDQELELDPPKVRRQVVIFSDFIEEDKKYNFMQMHELANIPGAGRLARVVASEQQGSPIQRPKLSSVPILLGGLESSELPRLAEERRAAIRQFWLTYFKIQNAKPTYVNDGPGMSSRFLALTDWKRRTMSSSLGG